MSPVRATALQLSLDLQLRTLQLSRYACSKRIISSVVTPAIDSSTSFPGKQRAARRRGAHIRRSRSPGCSTTDGRPRSSDARSVSSPGARRGTGSTGTGITALAGAPSAVRFSDYGPLEEPERQHAAAHGSDGPWDGSFLWMFTEAFEYGYPASTDEFHRLRDTCNEWSTTVKIAGHHTEMWSAIFAWLNRLCLPSDCGHAAVARDAADRWRWLAAPEVLDAASLPQLRTRCQLVALEELDAAPRAPEPGTPRLLETPLLPETPLPQLAVPAKLSPVFDEVASPVPAVICASGPLESPMRPLLAAPPVLPSVRVCLFAPAPERVRSRRRRVPRPLPLDEAEACEVNVCFLREAHGRKEKRERPPRLRDKGGGESEVIEQRERKRKRASGPVCGSVRCST